MEMEFSDNKPVVLITGCSEGGIGNALARAFASKNCFVVATSRSIVSMRDLVDDKNNQEDSSFFLQELDVLSEQSIQNVVSNVVEKFGRIDIVVNNAGVHCLGPLAEIPLSAVENTFNTNIYGSTYNATAYLEGGCIASYVDRSFHEGPIRLIQAVVPHMAARRKGKIVNIGSVTALITGPWAGAYSASKAALHALTDTLRMELRPFGIDVISVVPGAIKSNFRTSSMANYNQMPEWKLYKPFEKSICSRTSFSEGPKLTPAEEFAKKTVAIVLKKNPPAWFTYGRFSTIFAIGYHLPLFITDFIFSKAMKM